MYLYALLALTRTHPLEESIMEEETLFRMFLALLAHEVLEQV